jgi:hypothetical protein
MVLYGDNSRGVAMFIIDDIIEAVSDAFLPGDSNQSSNSEPTYHYGKTLSDYTEEADKNNSTSW